MPVAWCWGQVEMIHGTFKAVDSTRVTLIGPVGTTQSFRCTRGRRYRHEADQKWGLALCAQRTWKPITFEMVNIRYRRFLPELVWTGSATPKLSYL